MTFAQDVTVFVTLAEIAGVFVGFGALIAVSRRGEVAPDQLTGLRAVVTIGLLAVVAALVPVVVGRFGVEGHPLWLVSSSVFLALNWGLIVVSLALPHDRQLLLRRARHNPASSLFFWLVLELPIQLPLLITMVGLLPDLEPALYTMAVVLLLFEAAFVLAQLVYSREGG